MNNSKTYRHLDFSKLSGRKHHVITTEQSLKDVSRIEWSENVINGKKKVRITK